MNIALITPAATDCRSNAGAHMITMGIRYLLRSAVPDARFVVVEMLRDDPQQWNAAMTCDAAVLCGNPRFSISAEDAWWESGIWHRVAQLSLAGVRVIDGWAGATSALGAQDLGRAAAEIAAMARVAEALRWSKLLAGRITRDSLAQRIYESAGQASDHLPCSSWWAMAEQALGDGGDRDRDAVVLLALPGHHWMPAAIGQLQRRMESKRPCEVVATTWDDLAWARSNGLQATLVTEPASLLRLYARCQRVISCRVHAAIPAASVGCAVGLISIDSRALIAEPFGIPVTPFTALQGIEGLPACGLAKAPDIEPVLAALRRMLC